MQLRKILAIVTAVMTLTVNVYANEPIKIGVYLPLSGQNAFGGQLEIRGIELAHKKSQKYWDVR